MNKLVFATTPLEPIDFGVDIGDADGHKLFVLDVTPDQWKAIDKGDLKLPAGWKMDKKMTYAEQRQ